MYHFLQIITYASIGGIIPCLLWLVFWLREDSKKPEPVRLILACFVGGMIMTIVVIPFEYIISLIFQNHTFVSLTLWAFLEESAKFAACYFIALRSRYNDEPIDAVIYMITVALGFAALENTFYLITPLANGDALGTVLTSNIRFIGTSLLHTLASAIIGIAIAFSFYKSAYKKEKYLIFGFLAAGVLHTLFNFFILDDSGIETFIVFSSVWLLIILVIILLEKIKTITYKNI